MRIGILGGTFDPIHLGHLRSAEEVCQDLILERVFLIPSASPPHKIIKPITPFGHRLAMTHLAAGLSPFLEAMDLEGRRPGHSYSIETLRELQGLLGPEAEIFFILGMDAFLEINTWKEYENLFDYAQFIILGRPGCEPDSLTKAVSRLNMGIPLKTDGPDLLTAPSGKGLRLLRTTVMDISSTRIREMVKAGRSIRFLVPENVGSYIAKHGLYR